ncbi:unnamed protein product, partial [Phaeothamnion confervicola]
LPVNVSDSVCLTLEAATTPGLEVDKIYLLGGCDAAYQNVTGQCVSTLDKGYAFDPDTREFVATPTMPHSRFRFFATNVSDYVYIFGGRTADNILVCDIDYLHVPSNTWGTVPGDGWTNGYCASDGAAWTGDDGTIYLVGGYDTNFTTAYGVVNRVTFAVDTDTGEPTGATFETDETAKMTIPRGDLGCVRPPASPYAYCVGGF